MNELAFRTAADLCSALRRGEIRSRELLEHYLERIDRLNGGINAVVTLDATRAREQADAVDRRRARGEAVGPLEGLPMTVKDTFETAGMRTVAGATALAEYVPAQDAVAVARLRGAGAIVFGKTNVPLFAGDVQTYNTVFGTTSNPWDANRSPGGSSGGAAAAVAAGFTALEVGSDLGGSIRNPAHYCGVYGLKPSYGLIPLRGHIPGPPGTLADIDLAVSGPIARTAVDLELALGVLVGPDESDAVAWKLELPPADCRSLRDYRVAAWLDDPACPPDSSLREVFAVAVERLAARGVRVDERARPIDDLREVQKQSQKLVWPIAALGMSNDEFSTLARTAESARPDDDTRPTRFARGATIRHRDWLAVNEWRAGYRARWARFFRDFDVLLCPVMPTDALQHDHSEPAADRTVLVDGGPFPYWDQVAWAGAITAAYLPAVAAPIGRTRHGMPVGVQIVAPYLRDRTAIDFARQLADVVGGFEPPPGF
jgi:amidase